MISLDGTFQCLSSFSSFPTLGHMRERTKKEMILGSNLEVTKVQGPLEENCVHLYEQPDYHMGPESHPKAMARKANKFHLEEITKVVDEEDVGTVYQN